MEGNIPDHGENKCKHGENKMEHGENIKTNIHKCLREEREAGAHGEGEETMLLRGKHLQCAKGGVLPQLGVGLRVLMAEPMLGRFVISWLSPTRVGLGGGAH